MPRIRYTISVRELVNYSMLSGDIDSRFTTNASALDGIRLHRKIQEESPENYQSEVTLQRFRASDPGQGRRHNNRGPGIRDKSHGR